MGLEYDLMLVCWGLGLFWNDINVLKKTVPIKYSESIYMPVVLPLTYAFNSTLEMTVSLVMDNFQAYLFRYDELEYHEEVELLHAIIDAFHPTSLIFSLPLSYFCPVTVNAIPCMAITI